MLKCNRKHLTTDRLIDMGYKPIFYNANSGVVMSCSIQWTDEDRRIMEKITEDWNTGKDIDHFDMAGMRILSSWSIKNPGDRRPNNKPGWTVAIMRHL
ncbi:MAG: hypothetical protein HDQ88_11090 [Clostridia bacterium]|nr:hypothetical protein [Clostridia bacterium]